MLTSYSLARLEHGKAEKLVTTEGAELRRKKTKIKSWTHRGQGVCRENTNAYGGYAPMH